MERVKASSDGLACGAMETALGALGLREDEEPRRLAIQPVDDEEPAPWLLRVDVVPEKAVDVALTLALGGDGQEAGRLVDQEIVVLVDESESRREGHGAVTTERDADARADGRPSVTDDLTVDLDASVLEPLLEASPRRFGILLVQPIEERHDVPRRSLEPPTG